MGDRPRAPIWPRRAAVLLAVLASWSGGCSKQQGDAASTASPRAGSASTAALTAAPATAKSERLDSPKVTRGGLELGFTLLPEVRVDRIPMRTVLLRFRNVSNDPIRVYIPASEVFRAGISSITIGGAETHAFFSVPDPHPHGYVVTEVDFPLLAPGEEKNFEQSFSLDPMVPEGGTRTERRKGFEPGTRATVTWGYRNQITRWTGGSPTLDGPSRELFGGGPIPHIWTGSIDVKADWIIPD